MNKESEDLEVLVTLIFKKLQDYKGKKVYLEKNFLKKFIYSLIK